MDRMTIPELLVDLSAAFGAIGLVCLALIFVFWQSVGGYLGDIWAKGITELMQFLAGTAAIGSTFAAVSDKPGWYRPVVAGACCLLVWKCVQLLIDNRIKSTDRADKAALLRAERQSELRTELLTVFRFAVDNKARRVRRQVERPRQKLSTAQVRNALTPQPHLGELLQSLAIFFQAQLPSG